MRPVRAAGPVEVVSWTAETEAEECDLIAAASEAGVRVQAPGTGTRTDHQ
jgi:hypothetical protein